MKRLLTALMTAMLPMLLPLPATADLSISINFAPPELPVYEQPYLPYDGYIWMPGYWAYNPEYRDYYWVPGTWVLPPRPGYLWTPGYWVWNFNAFEFRRGYWGLRVGYYGGVNYGYGYSGYGYDGGRWDRGRFHYNRTVNNVNINQIHNTYTQNVVINNNINRVSYNGGSGGVVSQPDREQIAFEREQHVYATEEQTQHEQTARHRPELRRAQNNGVPRIAATPKAAAFDDRNVVPAKIRPVRAIGKAGGADESSTTTERRDFSRADTIKKARMDQEQSKNNGAERKRKDARTRERDVPREPPRVQSEQREQILEQHPRKLIQDRREQDERSLSRPPPQRQPIVEDLTRQGESPQQRERAENRYQEEHPPETVVIPRPRSGNPVPEPPRSFRPPATPPQTAPLSRQAAPQNREEEQEQKRHQRKDKTLPDPESPPEPIQGPTR